MISTEHEQWMRRALELAHQARVCDEVPVGAVIVRDGEIIGEGYNQPISSHDPTAHAEIIALRDAGARVGNYRLPGAILYVTIEPYTMCVGALIHARIATVVFGATEPRAGALVSHLQLHVQDIYNHRPDIIQGVLEEECAREISEFFQQRRG